MDPFLLININWNCRVPFITFRGEGGCLGIHGTPCTHVYKYRYMVLTIYKVLTISIRNWLLSTDEIEYAVQYMNIIKNNENSFRFSIQLNIWNLIQMFLIVTNYKSRGGLTISSMMLPLVSKNCTVFGRSGLLV